ncbi:MAG: hypothetical protein JWR27_1707 [Aeromicrobium sp.]|jgi:hypothetical protein|nr:hypothetical protein [Aeromicrobium sp.]
MSRDRRRARSLRRAPLVFLALALVAAAAIWWGRPGTEARAVPLPSPTSTTSATPAPPTATSPCTGPATGEITPTSIAIPGVVASIRVLALPRDKQDIPSPPPTTASGKRAFAWDRPPGVSPGAARGNVLLNAHTFPDGSALGNDLLDGLSVGDRILVHGDDGTICYRVDRRLVVPASKGLVSYYDTEGPHQLAIVVCSGRRLGPAQWTDRTIWFASLEGDATS